MNNITRRQFLKFANQALTVTGLAAIFGPIVAYFFPGKLEEIPSEPVLIGKIEELPENESKTVRFGRYPALVINTKDGLKAYSAVCTHFACLVKWTPEEQKIYCPCHDGYFDPQDGHVLSGPPPTALMSLPVKLVNGDIYIGGEA